MHGNVRKPSIYWIVHSAIKQVRHASPDQHGNAVSPMGVRDRPSPQGRQKKATNRFVAKHGSENAFPRRRQTEIKGLAGDGVWKSASSVNFRLRRRVIGSPMANVNWRVIAFWAALWWFIYSAPTEDFLAGALLPRSAPQDAGYMEEF